MTMLKHFNRNLLKDPSLWLLVFSNSVTIFFAITEHWNPATVLLIYWFQSIIIGFFNFIRILQLKEFSTQGFGFNGRPAEPTATTRYFSAFFFLFHYGFFHLIYLGFILTDTFGDKPNFVEFRYVLFTALLFFLTHFFSYIFYKHRDTQKQNIGSVMAYPYARIIPMHLTLIFGVFGGVLPLFLVLKTFTDVLMHVIEHSILRKGATDVQNNTL